MTKLRDLIGEEIIEGMEISGILRNSTGYFCDGELEICHKRGLRVRGEVVRVDGILCIKTASILMPYVSMTYKSTRTILNRKKGR